MSRAFKQPIDRWGAALCDECGYLAIVPWWAPWWTHCPVCYEDGLPSHLTKVRRWPR